MDPPTSPMALESQIAEHEHQALDLLDGLSDRSEADEAALEVVRAALPRLVATQARTLIDAATELARTEDRGSLEVAMLDEIRLTLLERPHVGLAIAPAVETTGVLLGLDRDGAAWAVLLELAEAHPPEESPLHTCSTAIAERLAAAQPRPELSRPLRVFRSATMAQAGPSVRAWNLAADHPEHRALARALVDLHHDAAALVDAFDEARIALAGPSTKPATTEPPPIDGPKRKFTYVHVILALIVLGLTLWHYVWR